MSRCSLKVKDGAKIPDSPNLISEVVVGLDYHFGWFAQVFEHDVNDPVIDFPTFKFQWVGRNRGAVLTIISKYCDITDRYTMKVKDSIVMDLDPGEVVRQT